MKKRISTRINEEQQELIQLLTREGDVTASEVMRLALDHYAQSLEQEDFNDPRLELLLENRRLELEEKQLELRHKQRTKTTRISKTCLYTLYYTQDMRKAVDCLSTSMTICELNPQEKQELHTKMRVLRTRDFQGFINKFSKDLTGLTKIKRYRFLEEVKHLFDAGGSE